jgi:hypothetical protein
LVYKNNRKGKDHSVVPEPETYGILFVLIAIIFYVSKRKRR